MVQFVAIALLAAAAIKQGQAANEQAKSNAAALGQDVRAARERALFEANQARERGRRLAGTQRADFAKAGVTLEGSPLAVLGETASDAELDALMLRYGGEVSARRSENQAALERYAGRQALQGSILQAGASIIGGSTKTAGLVNSGGSTSTASLSNFERLQINSKGYRGGIGF